MADEIKLPPLPEPSFQLVWRQDVYVYKVTKPNIGDTDVYTTGQMQAYATQAAEAYKAQQQWEAVPQCHKRANNYCKCSRNAMLCDGTGPLASAPPAPAQQPSDEQERAAFEAWMLCTYPGIDLSHRTDGSYWSEVPDSFLEGWMARAHNIGAKDTR